MGWFWGVRFLNCLHGLLGWCFRVSLSRFPFLATALGIRGTPVSGARYHFSLVRAWLFAPAQTRLPSANTTALLHVFGARLLITVLTDSAIFSNYVFISLYAATSRLDTLLFEELERFFTFQLQGQGEVCTILGILLFPVESLFKFIFALFLFILAIFLTLHFLFVITLLFLLTILER